MNWSDVADVQKLPKSEKKNNPSCVGHTPIGFFFFFFFSAPNIYIWTCGF